MLESNTLSPNKQILTNYKPMGVQPGIGLMGIGLVYTNSFLTFLPGLSQLTPALVVYMVTL